MYNTHNLPRTGADSWYQVVLVTARKELTQTNADEVQPAPEKLQNVAFYSNMRPHLPSNRHNISKFDDIHNNFSWSSVKFYTNPLTSCNMYCTWSLPTHIDNKNIDYKFHIGLARVLSNRNTQIRSMRYAPTKSAASTATSVFRYWKKREACISVSIYDI